MTINRKLLKQYRNNIQARLGFDDVIDVLISKKIVDENRYNSVYSQEANKSFKSLFDWILQDDHIAGEFIDILHDNLSTNQQRIAEIADRIVEKREEVRDVIVHAGLPHFPLNYVERTSQENIIKKKIQDLRPELREILVVYGMTGIGKSCLINQILQDPFFVELTNRAIFWLNLSQHEDDESIIQAMSELYSNAASLSTRVPVSNYQPTDLNSWKRALRSLFLDQNLRKALVILDDVKCRKIVDVLHCCRLIIITQDRELVTPSDSVKFHKIIQGFSESESLELFKKSLGTDSLPPEASEIHNLCEGFPMMINMIGSFLHDSKEEALSDNREIWKSIKEELPLLQSYKDEIVFMIRRNEEKLSKIYRTYFHDLSIFPKHVNIKPDILIELWDVTAFTLRQIMLSLANKSLIVSFYHNDLQSFVYSIHSLVYYYLINNYNDNERIIELHRKLINIYDTKSNDIKFKNSANYILGYFGYHLKHAKLYDRFSIYFDLNFLEKKLKAVGSIDLLRDFEIYKNYITKHDPILERKADDYKKFLTNFNLYLHQFPDANIVQYALYNNKIGSVFDVGAEIAKNNPEAVYFEVLHYCGENECSTSINLDQEITAICYTDSTDIVIFGTNNGDIRVVNLKYGHFYKKFNGHSTKIISIKFSPDKKRFLTISDDGKLRLWRYNINDIDSPSNKQNLWINPHTGRELNIILQMEQKDDRIITASFPNNQQNNQSINNSEKYEKLITGSLRGSLILWDINTARILMQTPVTGISINDVMFSNNNNEIIASTGKNIRFYKIGLNHLIYSKQYGDDVKINYLLKLTKSNQLIAIHDRYFNIWYETRKKITIDFLNDTEIDDDIRIVCATITDDDNYLILTTNSFIYVYDLMTHQSNCIRNDFRLSVLNTHVLKDEILLLGCNNLKLEQKHLQLQSEDRPIVKNPTQFTCYWRQQLPIYPILNRCNNKINLYKGNVLLSEYDLINNNNNTNYNYHDNEVITSTFSLCGNYIFFGCKNGNLLEFRYKKKTIKTIYKCDEEIKKINCFNNDTEEIFNDCSFTSNDDKSGLIVISTDTKLILLENEPKEYHFINGIFDYFYINFEFMVIVKCGTIKLLNSSKILFNGNKDWTILTADFNKDILVITFEKNEQYFMKIFNYNDEDETIYEYFLCELKSIPTVSKISSNCKLLAVGSQDGSILLMSIENLETTYLWLHKQAIQSLMFAPLFEPILVSLSDQIAFWNLKSFQNQSRNSTPNSGYTGFDKWCYKKTSASTPYLLSTLNLHGKLLKFVSASSDFLHFIVVDIDGNIHKLDVI